MTVPRASPGVIPPRSSSASLVPKGRGVASPPSPIFPLPFSLFCPLSLSLSPPPAFVLSLPHQSSFPRPSVCPLRWSVSIRRSAARQAAPKAAAARLIAWQVGLSCSAGLPPHAAPPFVWAHRAPAGALAEEARPGRRLCMRSGYRRARAFCRPARLCASAGAPVLRRATGGSARIRPLRAPTWRRAPFGPGGGWACACVRAGVWARAGAPPSLHAG